MIKKENSTPLTEIDPSWTLFLDRDGVINKKIDGNYVKTPDEFEFLPLAIETIAHLGNIFGCIVVVTNQQGIDKELMTHEDLEEVHNHMMEVITWAGGRIDEIYYCPHLAFTDSPCRKPNPGMGLQAKNDFPSIDFKRSIMVGDSPSDIAFGKKLGMKTVRIAKTTDQEADLTFERLNDFYLYLNNI